MLSCMTTPLGLTVIGPEGQPLRLASSHPAYRAGKDLLQAGLPGEQTWQRLKELVADPLKPMASWCARFGIQLFEDQDTLRLNDVVLDRAAWLPFLTRLEATAGTPRIALRLAAMLGERAKTAKVGQACLHVSRDEDVPIRLLRLERLPDEAEMGDKVEVAATTGALFLVTYAGISVSDDGVLIPSLGEVLSKVPTSGPTDMANVQDVLEQPCVLGHNRTYRCEHGTVDGWFEDFSFDGLAQARLNAKEMSDATTEARIINRITGELVRLA